MGGNNLITETDSNYQVKARYYRGNSLIAQEQEGYLTYYQFNGHGDVTGLTDTNGRKVQDYQYDAFGNQIEEEEIPNPFQYAGEYYDEESGLTYLRNRYYDSSAGRFITEDPVQDGMNWYTYCAGNPVMFVDPLGLADYIYYNDSNQQRAANATKQQLIDSGVAEDKIFLIHVTSADQFVTYWNEVMGTHDGTIDNVFIHMHGEIDFIQGGGETKIYVSDLESKTIDTIFLTACSTGNMNYIGTNVASQFAMTQDVKQVIAPDGLGYFVTPNHV